MMRAHRGLTLIELLIVLIILAVLTTLALRTTENVVSEARFDATLDSLENIRQSIEGDGLSTRASFIADIGRLPMPLAGAEVAEGEALAELWDRSLWDGSGAVDFLFQRRFGEGADADVEIACGWRGPYIQLGVGRDGLWDGWSNPFEVGVVDLGDGVQRLAVTSLGSDGRADNPGVDIDPYLLERSVTMPSEDVVAPSIVGSVFMRVRTTASEYDVVPLDFGELNYEVRLFSPNPGSALLARTSLPGTGPAFTITNADVVGGLLPGPRAIRIVRDGESSSPVYFDIPNSGNAQVRIVIPATEADQNAYDAQVGGDG
ncbi:MAG: prepilin-type N-terminal cleavage/methylation domain-containing protein [Planctomycetota bacterium]